MTHFKVGQWVKLKKNNLMSASDLAILNRKTKYKIYRLIDGSACFVTPERYYCPCDCCFELVRELDRETVECRLP